MSDTSKETVAAIVTCHASTPDGILKCLNDQTRKPDEIIVKTSPDPEPDEGDYGYGKRNRAVAQAKSKWLGFFCHDDSYHPKYLEMMLAAATPETHAVWCPWSDNPTCAGFTGGNSTLGNFLVRRDVFLARNGFAVRWDGNHGLRDADLIDRITYHCNRSALVKVPFVLYYHNVPYIPGIQATSWGLPVVGASYADWHAYTEYQLCSASKSAANSSTSPSKKPSA